MQTYNVSTELVYVYEIPVKANSQQEAIEKAKLMGLENGSLKDVKHENFAVN